MLKTPLMRVHAKFATALEAKVLNWAYNRIRGKGGYFKRDGKVERLPAIIDLLGGGARCFYRVWAAPSGASRQAMGIISGRAAVC